MPSELNVLSLNCWGLKYISTLRRERLKEIGKKLSEHNPPLHFVGLQELWTQEDYRSIREQTRSVLPYGKFYFGGSFGAGLAILSRWPILESSLRGYPLNGRPNAFYHGDWYVGKGVACAKVRIGPGRRDIVEIFTTHVGLLPCVEYITNGASSMLLMNHIQTTLIFAIELHRLGKSQNSCEARLNVVILCLRWVTST